MTTPEEKARQYIDRLLESAGWIIQDRDRLNLGAGLGIAVREFPLNTGPCDYLLFVERRAIGVIEAKPEGATLAGVEAQSARYSIGLGQTPPHWHTPLPFLYESTGIETYFTNGLDPDPRSRRVFAFHRPETLLKWVKQPQPLRARLQHLPPLITTGLWPPQIEAIGNLEDSLTHNRPRALIQMATGSGKTFTAVTSVYRLIKFAKAERVLFLVDRTNLGRQAFNEFRQYVTPDDGRKFTELYNVQHMQSNTLDPVSKVCITTVQRLYSMLRGEAEFDPTLEEQSMWELGRGGAGSRSRPMEVEYSPYLPPEYFDFIIIDECHRSIYSLWRQVLEYFDAFLVGLTATPAKHTFAFFNRNLVMEYSRQRAVADGVNVDGVVYEIRTRITRQGSTVEAGSVIKRRDKKTRKERWEALDDDLEYSASQLDREVVAQDQIATVIRAFRDRLFTELFPGRTHVPKTIVFAKDDAHAEAIVRVIREEFDKGNEFCKKITYRVTGVDTDELIAEFRNSYHPRIAVTVDMISTGTDIKPVECLLFMRLVKSRVLYDQMVGRGTRVIKDSDLMAVTPDAANGKDHFIIVDSVGIAEHPLIDTEPLERKRTVPFKALIEQIALGLRDEDSLASLAGRLARLQRHLTPLDEYALTAASGGLDLRAITHRLLDAIDPDRIAAVGASLVDQDRAGASPDPTNPALSAAAQLAEEACRPFDNPDLRNLLIAIQARDEQTIDTVSLDEVQTTGFSDDATARAMQTVESFRQFVFEHRDEIAALEIIYNQPYHQRRLTFAQVKELAEQLELPPHAWTTESLWRAYARLEQDRVRGVGGKRVLADLVALVRHAVQLDEDLEPYPDQVQRRYHDWLAAQEATGRAFTPDQRWWLDEIARHIGVNIDITPEDFDYGEFQARGGRIAAVRVFGPAFWQLVEQMNAELAVR